MIQLKKIFQIIGADFTQLLSGLFIFFPTDGVGHQMRAFYYRIVFGNKVGVKPRLGFGTYISSAAPISIGDRLVTGPHVNIIADQSFGIIIGNDVSFAHYSFIRASNHNHARTDIPIRQQGHTAKRIQLPDGREASIIVEDDVICGAYSIILSGAKIGKGSVIAAGSVVSSEIPPYSIVAGNPGRVIAKRGQFN